MGLVSEIRDPEKTYPGSRGQKGTGSGSATLVFRLPTVVFIELVFPLNDSGPVYTVLDS
jgi:hypothetical protein